MKTTRAEYVEDLKAIEDALVRFLYKHGRPAAQDLDVLYAVESVLDNPESDHGYDDCWEALADLVSSGFSLDDGGDDYRTDLIYEEVREEMEARGFVRWE